MEIEITPASEEKNDISVYCNSCKARTLHRILANYNSKLILDFDDTDTGEEKTYKLQTDTWHQIIECSGCLAVSFREVTVTPKLHEQFGYYISGTIGKVITKYYPERSPDYLVPKNYIGLPISIQVIYKEVVESYNHELSVLCAAGLRALVETICKELNISGNNLKEKIQNLSKSKVLGETTANSLDMHRFLGNYAMHLGERPDKEELRTAIQLSEHALDEIYSMPKLKEKLATLMTKRVAEDK
jgi:hypothetical protein